MGWGGGGGFGNQGGAFLEITLSDQYVGEKLGCFCKNRVDLFCVLDL
ncbi:hypothetical protein ABID21_001682 [Pseudorhizobium tarimense]|uniref:Uncharacterized protein n=1 Tax=Pseudorhizobium tarimense TaxID=1079109 RepID=A0ABV2H4W3_9HYPH